MAYTDDVVLLNQDPRKSQIFLGRLNDNVDMRGVRSLPSKCKMLKLSLLAEEWLGEVG